MIPSRWVPFLAVAVAGALAGILAGWALWRPKDPPRETYAPAIRQADGSLVLERKPMPEREARRAVPAPELPKGAKLERLEEVEVRPRAATSSPTDAPGTPTSGGARPPCPPVKVDLALVRMPDQTRRVVASSPDGEVVGGLDVPIEEPRPSRPLRWAAGGLYGLSAGGGRSVGAFLHRDLGPFRLGAELTRDSAPGQPGQWAGRALVGIRW